jgi:hypothetical protein
MNRSIIMRVARRGEMFIWFMFVLSIALYGFSACVLPRMIAGWTAKGSTVAPWILQVPIDAVSSFRINRFTVFPLLLLIAVSASYYAALDRRTGKTGGDR